MVPNRQQAITWTNDDTASRFIYAPLDLNELTHDQLDMHGYIISTVATDALVLKHQGINIHNAD